MHITLILAADSMHVHQDVVKCAKEAEVALVAQILSSVEKIEKLESKLAVSKRSDVSTPTSMQLEITYQEVVHLKAKFGATQAMFDATENEANRVSPMVDNHKRVNLELRFLCFAKDEVLMFIHAEVSCLKKVASKLESKEVDL
ncbi:hypothetical protein COP2_035434 [Malus domestica]